MNLRSALIYPYRYSDQYFRFLYNLCFLCIARSTETAMPFFNEIRDFSTIELPSGY